MEYVGYGDIEITKIGSCGGIGCDSCNCSKENYDDYKLYVTGTMIVLVPESGSDVILLPMDTNKITSVILKRNGL